LRDGAWLRHAGHANAMAQRLEAALAKMPGIQIVHPVNTNSVFANIPEQAVKGMNERGWKFYTHVGSQGEARLMCSWDTAEADVDAFTSDLREEIGSCQSGRF
jgi:threonine aldolase